MDRLVELAKRNVGNLDRLFSTLEDLHGDTLAANLDLLHEYAELTDLLDNFEYQTADEQELVAYRSIALIQRVKFLLNAMYGKFGENQYRTLH